VIFEEAKLLVRNKKDNKREKEKNIIFLGAVVVASDFSNLGL